MLMNYAHTHTLTQSLSMAGKLSWLAGCNQQLVATLWMKTKVGLHCFVSVLPLHIFVSPILLLSGFVTQSIVHLDLTSLIIAKSRFYLCFGFFPNFPCHSTFHLTNLNIYILGKGIRRDWIVGSEKFLVHEGNWLCCSHMNKEGISVTQTTLLL